MTVIANFRRLVLRVLAGMGLGFVTAATMAAPCDQAAGHDFDFWLGEWNVHTPDGKLAGSNSVKREYDGCVLHERYTTGHGYSGESLNIYDAPRKVWHQSWVDNTGMLLILEGGKKDTTMVLEGQTIAPEGYVVHHRISWTPNADGTVRQLWESSDAKGVWSIAFDGLYSKK